MQLLPILFCSLCALLLLHGCATVGDTTAAKTAEHTREGSAERTEVLPALPDPNVDVSEQSIARPDVTQPGAQRGQPAPLRLATAIVTPNPTVTAQLEKLLATHPQLSLVPTPETAQILLHVEISSDHYTAQPRLIGTLSPLHTSVQQTLRYHVQTQSIGQPPLVGAYDITTELPRTFSPAPNLPTPALTATDIAAFSQSLQPQLSQWLKGIPWQARVSSVLDDQHIYIPHGRSSGLYVGRPLQTATQPVSAFVVASFDAQGAILRKISGPLPRVGQFVVPQN